MHRERPRRGAALIDVLVAIVVLAIGGTAMIALLGQTAQTAQVVHRRELGVRGAGEVLSSLEVADRPWLLEHVGQSAQHGWTVAIAHVAPPLFDVTVAQPDNGAVLLRTTLYRPDTANAVSAP